MPPLLVAYAGLVLLNLLGVGLHQEPLEWLTKPLLAPVLALHLWRLTLRSHPLVLAALAFATAGDVALLLSGAGAFVVGTACFLGTQVSYLVAFIRQGAAAYLRARPLLVIGCLALWAAANGALLPQLGALAWAVVPYSGALLTMAASAWVMGPRAAWGGAVFVSSDLLVGLGAAGAEFLGRPVLVMATYAAAQFLLVDAFVHARTAQNVDNAEGRDGHRRAAAAAGTDATGEAAGR
ncbi:lysoplasmalogenase [Streptomyces sp. NPDC015414]|uniref:lysoplasmalogenase n=1 Tax=Streptomyces sp. NPDC015414 TaxID=3364957 RepID=UPI0036F7CA48